MNAYRRGRELEGKSSVNQSSPARFFFGWWERLTSSISSSMTPLSSSERVLHIGCSRWRLTRLPHTLSRSCSLELQAGGLTHVVTQRSRKFLLKVLFSAVLHKKQVKVLIWFGTLRQKTRLDLKKKLYTFLLWLYICTVQVWYSTCRCRTREIAQLRVRPQRRFPWRLGSASNMLRLWLQWSDPWHTQCTVCHRCKIWLFCKFNRPKELPQVTNNI